MTRPYKLSAAHREALYGPQVPTYEGGVERWVSETAAVLLEWMDELVEAGRDKLLRQEALIEGVLKPDGDQSFCDLLTELAEKGLVRVRDRRVILLSGESLMIGQWTGPRDIGPKNLEPIIRRRRCNVCTRPFEPRSRFLFTCDGCHNLDRPADL